ncbi:hypothetical protein C0030_000475 [Candidatus Liberibacter solanacearum]|uniref:Uncharacterized protein n=1 Tax=Candidatus Liberibacter solanacearum TaxID=556287 RepID=A0A3R7TJH1_9HYPH|nr:hypothetical protein C0030_001665 [Candidatus Liberibacter solanacearum]RPD37803.1 hypothetical protein C0030_000475 [Candidatus Liberibacter solanacearum]
MWTNTAVKQKPHKDSVDVRFAKVETTLPFLATKADLADVKTELKDAINNQTKWFMGIIVSILVSTIGILLKLSSH